MRKLIMWFAGGEQEVKKIRSLSENAQEYGAENITLHGNGGVDVKLTDQSSLPRKDMLKEAVTS